MKRLPKQFEKYIYEWDHIEWDKAKKRYIRDAYHGQNPHPIEVDIHELAGYALEWIMKRTEHIRLEHDEAFYLLRECQCRFPCRIANDTDFCECIFKGLREASKWSNILNHCHQ